jgi:hypothetical protein
MKKKQSLESFQSYFCIAWFEDTAQCSGWGAHFTLVWWVHILSAVHTAVSVVSSTWYSPSGSDQNVISSLIWRTRVVGPEPAVLGA